MKYSPELTECLSNLVAQQPFFATYLYNNMELGENPSISTARTNGTRIEVNPEWFGSKPIQQRVFIMAHEIMHGILDHMGRDALYIKRGFGPDLLPFNPETSNEAQDYVINAMLKEARIGEMPPSGLWDPSIKGDALSDEVYVQLNGQKQDPDAKDKSPDADGNDKGDGQGQAQGQGQPDQGQKSGDDNSPPSHGSDKEGEGFDEHVAAGEAKPEQEQKTAMAQAMQAAEAMGSMPESLKRVIGGLIDPEVSWEEQFRNSVTARQGQDTQTWRRPNRRRIAVAPHIYTPGKTGHQIGGLVLAVDVSGSLNEVMLTKLLSEAKGLLQEVKAEWVKVICWNTEHQGTFDIDDPEELDTLEIDGGGGTRLESMARYLDDEDILPEQIVWFTDGITRYSDTNPFSCDVTWLLTTDRRVPSYGTIIHMK